MLILAIHSFIFRRDTAFVKRFRAFCAIAPTPRHGLPCARQEHSCTIYIVCQISQADLGPGSHDADGSQNQVACFLCLDAEDMLYPRTDPGPGSVALLFVRGQFMVAGAFALDVLTKTVLLQTCQTLLGTIRRIRPYIPTRIGGKNFLKHIAVMHGRICNCVAPDQLVFDIHCT